jgi:hypothetical protein
MRRAALSMVATACLVAFPLRPGEATTVADASGRSGPLGPANAVSLDGRVGAAPGWALQPAGASPLAPVKDAAALQALAPAAAGGQYLVGQVRGSSGRVVQVSVNGALSAPITLSGVAQHFGVTAQHPDSGMDSVQIVAVGAWQPADSMQVSGLALGTSSPNVTSVQSGTREILLNGSLFIAKGYMYGNWPIGTPAPYGLDGWADNPAICQTDAALLGGAGANLIRLFQQFPDPAPAQNQTQCLDAFAANGVGVEFDLFPAAGTNPSQPTFTTTFTAQIAQQTAAWKAHPATLLWELDNEVEQNGDATATADWYGSAGHPGELDTMAQAARADDSNHLVGTGISMSGNTGCLGWMAATNAPALQFWGLHIYNTTPATSNCTLSGTTLATHAQVSAATTLPVIVDEFGVGRYSCSPGVNGGWLQWLSPVNVSWTPAYACATGSHEDQAAQANFLSTAWNDMAPYFASSSNPQGPFSGGLAWEYADQWWNTEASFFEPLPATPWTHETDGVQSCCGALPNGNGWSVPEFFSVNDATTPGDNGMRVSTLGFDALEQAWLGTTLPSLTGVSATLGGACPTATVTWTTSAAMTTQLDIGPRVVATVDGETFSDSTYYMQAVNNPALSTAHSVTLSGLIPGQDYQIAVRSFTSAGASVTTTPVDVTWMPSILPGVPASCPAPNLPPFPQLP